MRTLLHTVLIITLWLSPLTAFAEVQPTPRIDLSRMETVMLSQLSPDELEWYKTFQEGTFLITGWKEITEELLESTPPAYREMQARRLRMLGIKMGVEWSKDNAVRRVDTKMLQEWGKTLKKTAQKNPRQLPDVIVSIDQELNNLLN